MTKLGTRNFCKVIAIGGCDAKEAEAAPRMHGYEGKSAQIVDVSLARSLQHVTGEMQPSRILL